MVKNSFILFLTFFVYVNLTLAESNFKFPGNYPDAYTEYIYGANEVKIVTETYEKNVPKTAYPPSVNNAKENVVLDIYYCDNKNIDLGLKPLIIFSPGGGREKSDYKFIAQDLARRGFVAASINVRGNTLNKLQLMFKAKTVNPLLIMSGAMDLHNAINYIIKDRASALSIDPNTVIVAGGSLGGAISLQGAFMDRDEAVAKFGKDANNAFYDNYDPNLQKNNIKGVLDFYGAVYDVDFIKPTETKPVYIFHGSSDPAVPFQEGNLFYNPFDVYVYGGVRILEKIKENNSYYFITAKDVGHTLTPQCGYNVNSFPKGYPMNWYPDMLFFVKNAILGNQTIKVIKTVDCVEPECSMNKNSCRVVVDDANNASRKPENGRNVIPNPNFNKSIADVLPNVLITAKGTNPNNTNPTTNETNNNLPTTKPERLDHCKAFSFDGNDFIKLGNSPSVNAGFEVEFWFKQANSNADNNLEILYSIGKSNNIENSAFTFGLLGNNRVYVGYNNGNSYVEKIQNITDNSNNSYSVDNQWHHYHFKVANGNLTGEIDDDKARFNMPNAIKTSQQTDNSVSYIGGADFNSGNINYTYNYAIGQIHEVRIWQANSYSVNNMNISVQPNANGLVLYYKMNTNAQRVQDDAMYKIDGVLGSNANVEASDPLFVNNCDGSNVAVQKVEIPKQEPIVKEIPTVKVDSVSQPAKIIKEGISVVQTEKLQVVSFDALLKGKASISVLNSKNKDVVCKKAIFSIGNNSLNTYIDNLSSGNYTLKVVFNKKTYSEKISITK